MRALVLAPLVALAACGASPSPAPVNAPTPRPATPPAPPLHGYVLLKSTGSLRIAPSMQSPPLQLFASDDEASHATQDDPNPVFRVVGEKDDFVELETTFDAEHFCHDGLLGLTAYRLRFFARRDDFALVTPTAIDVDYSDGTGVTLSAGVVVRESGGAIEANPSGYWLKTPIATNAVADSFDPSPRFPTAEASYGQMSFTPTHGIRFAEQTFATFPSTHHPAFAEGVEIDAAKPTPKGLLATVVERCARYRILVDADDVDDEIGGLGGLGLMGKGIAGINVRRGATIQWKNGQIAGSTREDIDGIVDTTKSGTRFCWWVPLRVEGGPKVEICVDQKDLF